MPATKRDNRRTPRRAIQFRLLHTPVYHARDTIRFSLNLDYSFGLQQSIFLYNMYSDLIAIRAIYLRVRPSMRSFKTVFREQVLLTERVCPQRTPRLTQMRATLS